MTDRAAHAPDSQRPAAGLRLTVATSGLWLTAAALAGGLLLALGPGPTALVATGTLAGLAVAASLLVGTLTDRRAARALAAVAQAAGLADRPGDSLSIGSIVARLGRRLERAQHFRMALEALEAPLLVLDGDGSILAASRGLARLAPAASAGATLDAIFGPGYLETGGGAPEETMVTLRGRRFSAQRRPLPAGRYLLHFEPAGQFIDDDDLDALVGALATGRLGFRFEADVAAVSPALAALNRGLETLDAGFARLEQALAGAPLPPAASEPLARQITAVTALYAQRAAGAQQDGAARAALEQRLAAVGALLAQFESRAAALETAAGTAEAARAAAEAGAAAANARLATVLGRADTAGTTAGDAAATARQAAAQLQELERLTAEIDAMTATIEDVSFRTNLLALNAAVEAARAGDKGAGFAVVADEVRQLAQISNRSAKEVRAIAERGRAEALRGLEAAETLQNITAGLADNLRNLRDGAVTIAAVPGIAAPPPEAAAAAPADRRARA